MKEELRIRKDTESCHEDLCIVDGMMLIGTKTTQKEVDKNIFVWVWRLLSTYNLSKPESAKLAGAGRRSRYQR